MLAIFFVLEGITDLLAYFQNRSQAGSEWILFDGIVTLILGLIVWRQWPSSSLWVMGTLVGISMIFTGTTRWMLALAVRKAPGASMTVLVRSCGNMNLHTLRSALATDFCPRIWVAEGCNLAAQNQNHSTP